jgi:hypothetical protein
LRAPGGVYRGDDPVAFAVSLNLHRRHLTARERAEVAARIANLRHGTNRYRSKKVETPNGAFTRGGAVSIKQAARVTKEFNCRAWLATSAATASLATDGAGTQLVLFFLPVKRGAIPGLV